MEELSDFDLVKRIPSCGEGEQMLKEEMYYSTRQHQLYLQEKQGDEEKLEHEEVKEMAKKMTHSGDLEAIEGVHWK